MKTKIAILLGAGSSVPAGFPPTDDLTKLVLSGQGVTRSDGGCYYIGDNKDESPPVVLQLVKSMVKGLHAEAERYYSEYAIRPTNYEDIYYLARQARDELLGNMENPAIRSFVDELGAKMSPSIQAANETNEDLNEQFESHIPNDLTKLLEETCNYIADVVSQRLLSHCPTPESMRQLRVIEDACNSFKVTSISTLCHDTHVETFLNSKGVALSDGFSETRSGCTKDGLAVNPPHWNGDLASDGKTPFLKLHGSVDWFRYTDGHIRRIPPDCRYERIEIDGKLRYAEDCRPQLLIGTFNKMSDYSSGISLDLRCRFRSTIKDASRLVICGYSFGDKGINNEIVDWVHGVDGVHGEEGRRLVIIHPDHMDLVANARVAIQKNWDNWKYRGWMNLIEKTFECVNIADLEKAISP